MKKITTTRKANRRPARELKNPSGVQNQLSRRRSSTASKKSSAKPNMNTTLEQDVNEETALAVAQEPKNSKAEFTRGELGKAKRAFAKRWSARCERRDPQEVASGDEGSAYRRDEA